MPSSFTPCRDDSIAGVAQQVERALSLTTLAEDERLFRDSVYEFAFIFAPLRLKGATGSPGNPLAIR